MHDTFYFTDVHGYYDLYKAAMNYCMAQDPECCIIYGGDACDRGPDGYRIMKELLNNPQVLYLKGNHEDMFVKAAHFILQDEFTAPLTEDEIQGYLYFLYDKDDSATPVQLSMYNGGFETLRAWMMNGMPNNFVNKIAKLPLTFSMNGLDFCHAGGKYNTFLAVSIDEYEDNIPDMDDEEILLWDRNYLSMGWMPERICIYGHTPVYHLPAKYYGQDKSKANAHPCLYSGFLDNKWTGQKLDMDVGTYNTGKLYVLNCLTMKAKGFIDKDFERADIKNHTIEEIEVISF